MGRPSKYTDVLAATICERIANGESLRHICEAEDMPSRSAVLRWLAVNEQFRDQYARAREAQADFWADEILDIADDGQNDWMEIRNREGEAVGWRENGEAINRSKLRVDARKWLMSKLAPKKYSDRLISEHTLGVTDALADLIKEVDERRAAAARMADPDAIALEGKPAPLRH